MEELFARHESEEEEEFEEQKFGNYTLEKKIGKGGQGTIFQAVKKGSKEKVALKISNNKTKKSKKKFAQETEALNELNGNNPGVVKILETGIVKKTPFIALELVEGSNLENILNKYKNIKFGTYEQFMPEDYVINILVQSAEILKSAHEKGVIHGDVKPANILITKDDKIKIADFGLSKLNSEIKNSLSVSGEVAGTIQYMSPEIQGGSELCTHDDIYSFGILIYHLLTNRFPIDDRFSLNPSDINKKLNKKIDDIYQKCIAKTEERYNSMTELIKKLNDTKKEIINKNNQNSNKVYYTEDSSFKIAKFLVSKGYILGNGRGRREKIKNFELTDSIGILKKGKIFKKKFLWFDYETEGRAYFIGLFNKKDKNWHLDIYGRENVSELEKLMKNISKYANVNIKMELKSEISKKEYFLKDDYV